MADGNLIARDDVVIVGAGPVGLTLAAELVRHGARVRILDRQPGPVEHSNALILHVRTLELFEAMGIVGRFLKASFPVELVSLHTQSGRLGSIGLVGVDGAFPGPRIVSQAHVERVLIGHLEELGVTVERSTEATGFVQTETGVTVKTHGPSGEGIAAARWLVGCDGARSSVRDWAGIGSKGQRYEDLEFTHADCRVRWSYPSGRAYGFLGGKSAMALFPFDGQGRYRVLCARQKPASAQSAEPPTADEIRDALRAASNDPTAELTEIDWLSRWHSGHRLADRFQEDRVFLAGDAAHSHVPLGGQGMNIGIQDAVNLGWKLAAVATGQAKPKLLESYNPERRPIAEEIVHMTDRGIRALTHPRDPRALAMRMFGSTVIALEGVQDRIRRLLGEVSFSYSTSILSEDLGGSTGPIAGERVLDSVAVRASDRRTVRLYEMLERAPWTLMLFAGTTKEAIGPGVLPKLRQIRDNHPDRIRLLLITIDTALPDWPGECLIDREEYVHERYGARGPVVYLIRPDCYIGFRAPLARLDTIQAYLDRWLIPRA